ncbi:MAG: hypothetical protein KDB26_10665 [Microthrixaceae bacterium]|nr:hypothetical protein [Microthrixaceae bacterium]
MNSISGSRPEAQRKMRLAGVLAIVIAAMFLGVPTFAGAGSPAPTSNITITQTDSGFQGWCLPGFMVLSRELVNTNSYYELIVHAAAPPCEPINATAAIYGMPGNGVAWPQNLIETKNFTISRAGTTVIRFTKTCDPVQFDVLTGDTPQVISPQGPWHGPLLFPFDMETSVQHWGCVDNTTTSSDPCENYAARQLAVTPTTVTAGNDVTVSGLGTPGTSLLVSLKPPSGSSTSGPSATVNVPASGQWSVDLSVPTAGPAGTWSATAQASDCEGVTSVEFTVNPNSGPGEPTDPSTPGNPSSPSTGGDNGGAEVGGITDERPLPDGAVLNANLTNSSSAEVQSANANNTDRKLAWTGSNVRIPIILGSVLLMAGVLLILRSRHAAENA